MESGTPINNVNAINQLHKIKDEKLESEQRHKQPKPKEYPLSICVIYCEEDERYLQGCVESLPIGCEVILMKTIPVPKESIKPTDMEYTQPVFKIHPESNIKFGQSMYRYAEGEFDFSKARNVCKKLASRAWILSIDADERLLWEHSELEILNHLGKNIGGLFVGLTSNKIAQIGFNGQVVSEGKWQSFKVMRMFRNLPIFNWEYICHEQIKNSILDNGYDIAEHTLLIKHVGYMGNRPQEIINKLTRNHALLCKELAINPLNPYIMGKEFETLNLLRKNGFFKADEGN
jgi:hypothetical protein